MKRPHGGSRTMLPGSNPRPGRRQNRGSTPGPTTRSQRLPRFGSPPPNKIQPLSPELRQPEALRTLLSRKARCPWWRGAFPVRGHRLPAAVLNRQRQRSERQRRRESDRQSQRTQGGRRVNGPRIRLRAKQAMPLRRPKQRCRGLPPLQLLRCRSLIPARPALRPLRHRPTRVPPPEGNICGQPHELLFRRRLNRRARPRRMPCENRSALTFTLPPQRRQSLQDFVPRGFAQKCQRSDRRLLF